MTITKEDLHAAYRVADDADKAWHAELIELHGSNDAAVRERYRVVKTGEIMTPKHQAFRTACDRYFALVAQHRAQQQAAA